MPIVVAHRGLHTIHPENSAAAFAAAWEAGLLWAECDVHLSADGVPFVIHDATLERTTEAVGFVALQSSEVLCEVRLRPTTSHTPPQFLPTLDQIVREMPANCTLLVEAKIPLCPNHFSTLAGCFQKNDFVRNWMFHSFDPDDVTAAVAYRAAHDDWTAPIALLTDSVAQTLAHLTTPADAIHPRHSILDTSLNAAIRARGKKVGVWTPNDSQAIARLSQLDVDLIISDVPELARLISGQQPG